jgi:hypothetical protein
MRTTRRTLSYSLGSFMPLAAALILLMWSVGRPGILLAGLGALPWLAWRYDNETGAFLPLAVLLLFVFAVLALLLFLVTLVFFAGR